MKFLLQGALTILLIFVVGLALLIGISLGLGWLLTLFLPFTLFEGSLLAMIAVFVVGAGFVMFFRTAPFGDTLSSNRLDIDNDYKDIPEDRVYKSDADRTWENHYRHEMANQIYTEFQDAPTQLSSMGDKQMQELALRLSEIALAILKAKSPRATQLKITRAALVKQMQKMDQQPYGDDILELAMIGINDFIFENYDDLRESIESKDWRDKALF